MGYSVFFFFCDCHVETLNEYKIQIGRIYWTLELFISDNISIRLFISSFI